MGQRLLEGRDHLRAGPTCTGESEAGKRCGGQQLLTVQVCHVAVKSGEVDSARGSAGRVECTANLTIGSFTDGAFPGPWLFRQLPGTSTRFAWLTTGDPKES